MNKPRFIATKLDIDIATGEVLSRDGYWYDGPVAECKGADAAQEQQQKQQADFATSLARNYATQFAGQKDILDSLHATLKPIIAAGPSQYGFSNAEDAALRTQASAGTSVAFRKDKQSLGDTQASIGGGDEFLPTGTKNQQEQDLATAAAKQESDQQLGITDAGYDVGRKQFDTAVGADSGIANLMNPSNAANNFTSASSEAYKTATNNAALTNAASPWNAVGGILGGVAGAFLGPMGTAVGSKLGSGIAGAITGTGSSGGGGGGFGASADGGGASFGTFDPTSD